MRKKFRSKKRYNVFKFLFKTTILIYILYILLNNIFNIKIQNSNNNLINKILNDIDYNIQKSNKLNSLSSVIDELFTPKNILTNEFNYIKNNNFLLKSNNTNKYNIYIYNSHQKEEYSNKTFENYNIRPTVLTASYILEEKLEKLNINTIVEGEGITNYMKEKKLNHGQSYIASRVFLQKMIDENPNMNLYIDLHRDAISHDNSIVSINNKTCAKILFVIGLENPNYEKNLNVVEKLNNIIVAKYPNLSRGIIKKQGKGVNGIYNQDLNNNVILIEIGGNENSLEEINNTLELVAIAIGEYVYG